MTKERSGGRVLVVEDDPSIALGLRMNLETEGYDVAIAEDGVTGLERAREGWDLVILDVMLPRMNGLEVVRTLRAEGHATPVLILSARSAEMDKVLGLELGAEDYVTKPFGLAELLARVRVAMRRRKVPPPGKRYLWEDIVIDPERRQITRGGAPVEVTAKEFDVLLVLIRAQGRVLSRDQIFEAVWGENHHGTTRTIDNFMAQLRHKLEVDPAEPKLLVTVRGVGYRLGAIMTES